jgi:hypothetical protein
MLPAPDRGLLLLLLASFSSFSQCYTQRLVSICGPRHTLSFVTKSKKEEKERGGREMRACRHALNRRLAAEAVAAAIVIIIRRRHLTWCIYSLCSLQ